MDENKEIRNFFTIQKLLKATTEQVREVFLKEWKNYFIRQMDLGYNSFHFAPIQQTGESKSYYSLKDHLDYSDDIFEGSREDKKRQLQGILS